MNPYSGLFISLEGCEGCGKSTQARILHKKIQECGIPAVLTQEPGGTPLGNKIRDILKIKGDYHITPETELLLFAASRFQLMADVIKPALDGGKVVVCDRFSDSTVVYQGYARGLDLKIIEIVNNIATGGLKPDVTILLDTQADIGLGRKRNRQDDRFEAENISFHHKVRDGYLKSAQAEPGRWMVIDARKPVETVTLSIWERLLPVLRQKYPAKAAGC